MHVQIVNFNLKGVSEGDFQKLCDEVAPSFAQLPGLISKVFLANPATNTYGGVYIWQDRQAMENFTKTDLFRSIATHPNLDNVTSKDFAVLEAPTRITRGLVETAV
jgi:hypothetical protein